MVEARLFSVVCRDRTRNNILQLEQRNFCTNVQKNLFTVRVTEYQNRLPGEDLESPMEIFTTCLDAYIQQPIDEYLL